MTICELVQRPGRVVETGYGVYPVAGDAELVMVSRWISGVLTA